jgi:dienelactone hydrolase
MNERTTSYDVDRPLFTELLPGSDRPVEYFLAETMDGLYTPYALRTPADDDVFPFIFLAYGNGGGGLEWLRNRVRTNRYIMERFLAAGYACAWGRYRSEVELGFNEGGRLVADRRQGMDLFNRAPLEFEDEVSIIQHVRRNPNIDPERIGHVGVSHAGEMLFKLASQYPGVVRAGVACEPANHEFLDLTPDSTAFVNPETNLRNIEEMQMRNVESVRARVNEPLALERMSAITVPILVMGRDDDHLQGIFRTSYDLLAESGKETTWISWDHPLHGYIFPVTGEDDVAIVDEVQDQAIDGVIAFLDRYLKTEGVQ